VTAENLHLVFVCYLVPQSAAGLAVCDGQEESTDVAPEASAAVVPDNQEESSDMITITGKSGGVESDYVCASVKSTIYTHWATLMARHQSCADNAWLL